MFDWQEIGKSFLYNSDEPLVFQKGVFLLLFAVFLIIYSYAVKKKRWQHVVITLFSAYFYYKASGIFLLLLLSTISIDYVFSFYISKQQNKTIRKWLLFTSVFFSLSFLFYFKYRNFFVSNVALSLGKNYSPENLILPIGISFYTFQSISYLVDIYSKKIKRPKFREYLMYMMFFPHLVAGPIVRASDFLPQVRRKFKLSKTNLNEAFYLISKGLIKKAIIADYVAQYADIVYSAPKGFSGSEHLLAGLCYTLQIFCDFSGYTDMAIGIALLLGYRLCLNFDSPYKSLNITEFWRRWHISLSSWLRDYVYIPLGGNKKGFVLQLLFLLTTMLIGGFWHGADWKFIFWGGAHGFLLILHKLWIKYKKVKPSGTWFNGISWVLTFSVVLLLWIPFRATTINDTWLMYSRIFSQHDFNILISIFQTNPMLLVLLIIGFTLTILRESWKQRIIQSYYKLDLGFKILIFILIIQGIIQMQSSVVQPFIYFQF